MAFLVLACALLLPAGAFAQSGSLQVSCEPGARIYIDHQFMGVTNETDSGLFIESLSPGEHRLRAVMTGREPAEMQVAVIEGMAVEVTVELPAIGSKDEDVEDMKKEAPPIPKPRTDVGTLVLSSDPVGAKIYIDGTYKGDADIVVDNPGAGRHTIVFQLGEQKLSGTYTLRPQEVLKLKANFLYEDIVNLSEQQRRQRTNRPIVTPGR